MNTKTIKTRARTSVTKGIDGEYRWILVETNSYMDLDGEIVSQKALEADTDRMNAEQDFGGLDWFHAKTENGTPLLIGEADTALMFGRFRVTSGKFLNEAIGKGFHESETPLQASIEFYGMPDDDGVFHEIKTIRRAMLPAGTAANPLTAGTV